LTLDNTNFTKNKLLLKADVASIEPIQLDTNGNDGRFGNSLL